MAAKLGLKAICFARSRLMVEVITKYLKDVFDKDPRKPPRVLAYRGGYLPSERRRGEQAMRAGRVDTVVSTSALELGVDIGSLDVAVLNGYPGAVAATWQRLGRAGRLVGARGILGHRGTRRARRPFLRQGRNRRRGGRRRLDLRGAVRRCGGRHRAR